jgi:hypothetical protein
VLLMEIWNAWGIFLLEVMDQEATENADWSCTTLWYLKEAT